MRYLLHDVFSQAAEKFPDNIAITTENGVSFTYNDIDNLSNQFANHFLSYKENTIEKPFVGILSTVNPISIAAVLGALKIGCAYIPLDEYSPTERLKKIVENTKLDILVMEPYWYETHKELLSESSIKHIIFCGEGSAQEIAVDTLESVKKNSPTLSLKLNQVSDDLAYILHSSGSTGIPKGIMLTHRNARTFVDWMQKEFSLTPKDRVMSRAPFKFDLSIFDIFNTFKAGACLVCFDWLKQRENENKHEEYVQLMVREKATILYTTPSTFISLLNKGFLAEQKTSLRTIMYAGEPFPPAQLRKVMSALPGVPVANIYGPTETNIITYFWITEAPQGDEPIPLGAVVDDTEILVVSEDSSHICIANEVGELWCRGGTVTLGYLGLTEKNKESYVQSPFHKYPVHYWRTGDFGFRDNHGVLHYRGRRDHMVKVLGYRIELGEIENALAQYDILDEFAVVAVPDEKYGNRLYCYYSTINNQVCPENSLEEFLKTKIPEYMIPYQFKQLDALPKTSSGKVDRVRLAAIAGETYE